MKKMNILFCGLLLLGSLNSFAQFAAVGLPRTNVLYIGIQNPVYIAVENHPCRSLIVSTNNGTLEKLDECRYIIYPQTISDNAIIYIHIRKGNKKQLVEEVYFRVRNLPHPVVNIGSYRNGDSAIRGQFLAQTGIGAHLPDLGFELQYLVTRFNTIIFRNGEIFFMKYNTGNVFSPEIKEGLKMIKSGDVIMFTGIHVKRPDNIEFKFGAMEISIR